MGKKENSDKVTFISNAATSSQESPLRFFPLSRRGLWQSQGR